MTISNIQTNNEVISNGYVNPKFIGKMSTCFFCFSTIKFLMVSWEKLSNSCDMTLKQQAVQVQCTFLVCHWNRQLLVIDYHWSNTLEQYFIQIWYIFIYRLLVVDVFKFYKFLFWLSEVSKCLTLSVIKIDTRN